MEGYGVLRWKTFFVLQTLTDYLHFVICIRYLINKQQKKEKLFWMSFLNSSKIDSGESYTALWMYLTPLNCTFKNG